MNNQGPRITWKELREGLGAKWQESGSKNQGPRAKQPRVIDPEPRNKNQELVTKNQTPRTKDQGPRIKHQEPRTKNQEPRNKDRAPRTQKVMKMRCDYFLEVPPIMLSSTGLRYFFWANNFLQKLMPEDEGHG